MKALLTKKRIIEFIYLTCGVAIASFSFSFFLSPNSIVVGGVSGISIIMKELLGGYNPATVILLLNLVLLFIGFIFLGKEFFLKTAYGSLMFPVFIWMFDFIYKIMGLDFSQMDIILVILFSAIITGAGLGIVVKYGGTTGGTEIPQRILFKFVHLPYSLSLYIIDGTIILVGFILMKQQIDLIFYEIIFMVICGFAMDTVVFSGFNKRAVYIISEKTKEIKEELLINFNRGVTSVKVIGEYSKSEKKMLLCVLSTLEYYKLRDFIGKLDENAFFFAVRASEVRGEGFSYAKED